MELLNPAYPLGARRKESGPEVKSALLLSEAAARDDADTGSLEQTHAVEVVGVLALLLGSFDEGVMMREQLGGRLRDQNVQTALNRVKCDWEVSAYNRR